MRAEYSLALVALLLMLAQGTLANDLNIVVKALGCNGQPLANAKVSLSGCVDGTSDNPKAKPVFKITNEYGIAAFTRDNADNDLDTEDVIQYCWGSAWNNCRFNVDTSAVQNGAGITFGTYELPKPPKLIVRDTCSCNVCRQFLAGGECPRTVNFPGCSQDQKVIVLRPTTCNVGYTTSPCGGTSKKCGQDEGALCINEACPTIQAKYQFCSFGGTTEKQMTLSFACPASGTLSLKASAYNVRDGCGARDGLRVQKVKAGAAEDVIPFGTNPVNYNVDLTGLPCDANTVYTVTEDTGIILTDTIQAVFTPSATSGY